MSKVKNKLFFESDEEDDTNVLKKQKNIFSDDTDDAFGVDIDHDLASFQQRREQQLHELSLQDKKNEKEVAKLKAEASLTLQGSTAARSVKAPITYPPVETASLGTFFDEEDEIADQKTEALKAENVKESTLHQTKQNANEHTKGVFAPAGTIQWEDKESIALKNQIEAQKKQTTSLLFDDDEEDEGSDVSSLLAQFSSTSLHNKNDQKRDNAQTQSTASTQSAPSKSTKIDMSLFDNDDDNDDSIPSSVFSTSITNTSSKPAQITATSSQFMSLFDDDDDDSTATGKSDDFGDDFDFASYITNQK